MKAEETDISKKYIKDQWLIDPVAFLLCSVIWPVLIICRILKIVLRPVLILGAYVALIYITIKGDMGCPG